MRKPRYIDDAAREFAVLDRQGGWRLGFLVARAVEPGAGQGRRQPPDDRLEVGTAKVSAEEFGRRALTSAPRIRRYYAAWERAAAAGIVPHAATFTPSSVDIDLPDDRVTPWSTFFDSGSTATNFMGRNTKALAAAIAADEKVAEAAASALAEHRPATVARQAAKPDVARAIAEDRDSAHATDRALAERATRRRHDQRAEAEDRRLARGDEPSGWEPSDRDERLGASPIRVAALLAEAQDKVREAAEVVRRQGSGPDAGHTIVAAIERLRSVLDDFQVLVETGDADRFDAALAALTSDLNEGDHQ